MNKNLIPICDEEFKSIVNIRFNNVLSGLDDFINFTLNPLNIDTAEEALIKTIETIFKENNNECYIDFYINKISEEDKINLLNLLSLEDKEVFKELLGSTNHSGVYFKLISKELIPFLTRLNTREAFFVTFYFINKPITIWGNYGMKFPCFFKTEEDRTYYYEVFKSSNLIQ